MKPRHWLLLTRLTLGIILAASTALYLHYLDPADSGFCGLRSGCEAVRRKALGQLGPRGLSLLPLLSLLAYGSLFAVSLLVTHGSSNAAGRGWLPRNAQLVLFAGSGVGGAIALGLIAVQALWIGEFCWLCLVVDIAAIAVAAFAFGWARARTRPEESGDPLELRAWLLIAASCILAPLGWTLLKPAADIPPAVAALYQPDKINVVEFADFQCPFCRRLHTTLAPVVKSYGDRVHFLRLHRPLDQHPMAEPAARAAICAAEQGKGEPMADALFSMDLSPQALTVAAERLGLDPGAYDACLGAPSTDAMLDDHYALLSPEEFEGLPTTFIGHQKILGARGEAELRDLLRKAERGPGPRLPGSVYVGLWLFALGLVCVTGLSRSDK